jgi:site-specific recombinase XerD
VAKFTVSLPKKTGRRICGGPLGPYIDPFIALLEEQGYRRRSVNSAARIVADFSRWLYGHYLDAKDCDVDRVRRFLIFRKRAGAVHRGQRAALIMMMGLLHKMGVAHVADAVTVLSDSDRITKEFGDYMLNSRGLSPSTRGYYLPFVSLFLTERFGPGQIQLQILNGKDVTGFVQRHAYKHSHSYAQMLVQALRAFLRYLRHQGSINIDLASSVPKVAQWSFAGLPRLLSSAEVQEVLRCCDTQTHEGLRDYAIVLLLAHLGLRAGEVANLTFEQIDWREGCLSLRNKGGQWTRLPLPQQVGQALADYLAGGRPSSIDRHVFIRAQAPRHGYASTSISALSTRALARAGIDAGRTGAHIFRHALATEMLRKGASLSEIGQLLRHKHPDTTRIYAKVDLSALREIPPPWPEGAR